MERKTPNKLMGRFWITKRGENIAGAGRVELLRRIRDTGSISSAAKQMEMSYKAAWDSVNAMNRLSDSPLVERSTGGRHGGGTILTKEGEEFIALYEKYTVIFDKILNFMEENPETIEMIDKTALKTSADNVFCGKITKLERGAVNSLVHMETERKLTIVASVTAEAQDRMGLREGLDICALINANRLVLIEYAEELLVSARNQFSGSVSVVSKGAVNSEITLDTNVGNKIHIVVTNESAANMELSFGKRVRAYCKASDVIILA